MISCYLNRYIVHYLHFPMVSNSEELDTGYIYSKFNLSSRPYYTIHLVDFMAAFSSSS